MLPSELLFSNRRGPQVYPKFLAERRHPWAAAVLDVVREYQHQTRGELMQALRTLEGDSPDYRLIRGFAHLVLNAAEFCLALQEPAPEELRRDVFATAAEQGFGDHQTRATLQQLSQRYSLLPDTLRDALYADLPERHILQTVPDYSCEALVDRYNLAQAQGLLYSALHLRINAHRNVPGEYRRLFKWLKFYGLMYAVEGNLEDGYQIYADGPVSLFRQTRKYGIQMAKFLPALLHVSRWEMQARLMQQGREVDYRLTSDSPLRSHYAKPPEFDSLLEQSFVERWQKLDSGWRLEREVEIVDLKGTVFVPDFALRDDDGRLVHIEIVGFWHPDYLRRKLDKVRRADMRNLILAVSDRLNVGEQDIEDIPGPVLFFKGKLEPRKVLEVIERERLS